MRELAPTLTLIVGRRQWTYGSTKPFGARNSTNRSEANHKFPSPQFPDPALQVRSQRNPEKDPEDFVTYEDSEGEEQAPDEAFSEASRLRQAAVRDTEEDIKTYEAVEGEVFYSDRAFLDTVRVMSEEEERKDREISRMLQVGLPRPLKMIKDPCLNPNDGT